MILALVFLLFCTFVGGSVLAVSASNSARIRHLKDEEQQFLNQRSAVTLMKDKLTEDYSQIKMTVHHITKTTQEVQIGNGGVVTPVGDPHIDTSYTFIGRETEDAKPAIQRLVYESAILQTLRDPSGINVTLDKLVFTELDDAESTETLTLSPNNNFWLQEYSYGYDLEIAVENSDYTSLTTVAAKVICEEGATPYNFWVTFGEDGQDAQVSLRLRAIVSESPAQQGAPYFIEKDGKTYQVVEKTTTTVITWQQPEIVKGGIDG